jgi:hypothetical protein
MILGIDIVRGLGAAVVVLAIATATTTLAQEVDGIDDFGTAGNALRAFQADRQVLSGKFKAEVEQALQLARKSMILLASYSDSSFCSIASKTHRNSGPNFVAD